MPNLNFQQGKVYQLGTDEKGKLWGKTFKSMLLVYLSRNNNEATFLCLNCNKDDRIIKIGSKPGDYERLVYLSEQTFSYPSEKIISSSGNILLDEDIESGIINKAGIKKLLTYYDIPSDNFTAGKTRRRKGRKSRRKGRKSRRRGKK
jgi:hypothetical protein